MRGNFRDPLRAGTVVRAGHARFAPEGLYGFDDALIVGGPDDAVHGLRQLGTRVHHVNHRLPRELDQRLSRHPRRAIAGRNYHHHVRSTHSIAFPTVLLARFYWFPDAYSS